jgi:hypothetical protein
MKVKQVVEAEATEVSFWGTTFNFEDAEGNEIAVRVTEELVHRLAKRLATKSAELREEAAEAARLTMEEADESII